MSEQTNPKELLSQVGDTDLRSQLEAVFDGLSGSALRQQVESLSTEVKTLKAEKRQRAYRDAGIPEASYDVLDKVYEGELAPDAIRTFAKEKGFAISDAEAPANGQTEDPAEAREAGEQRLQSVGSGALPVREPSINDRIQQAEADGDWDTVNRLNAQKLEAARRSS